MAITKILIILALHVFSIGRGEDRIWNHFSRNDVKMNIDYEQESVETPPPDEIQVKTDECKMDVKNISFKLSNMGLTRIEDEFIASNDVTYLHLDNNPIERISSNAFSRLPNLRYLDLLGTWITLGDIVNLNGLEKLETLVLSNTLHNDHNCYRYRYNNDHNMERWLPYFPNLKYLYLERSYCFNRFNELLILLSRQLTHLYLAQNNIDINNLKYIPDTITHLYLQQNAISKINVSALSNIEHLVIDHNPIQSIHYEYSSFSSVLSLQDAKKLKYLSVKNNRITEIGSNAFKDAIKLTYLDLSYNQIKHINEQTFLNMNSLQNLSISDNLLTSTPHVSNATALRYLNLTNNNIEEVLSESFHNLFKLETLILKGNKISNIPDDAFTDMINLNYLDLSDNLLQYLPSTWNIWNSLRILHIESNLFSNIRDMYLRNATSQTYIYMQENPIMTMNSQDLINIPKNIVLHIQDKLETPTYLNKLETVHNKIAKLVQSKRDTWT